MSCECLLPWLSLEASRSEFVRVAEAFRGRIFMVHTPGESARPHARHLGLAAEVYVHFYLTPYYCVLGQLHVFSAFAILMYPFSAPFASGSQLSVVRVGSACQ